MTIGYDQLNFNCADKKKYPKSTGHPVLTDPAFRQALQWAIDKDKIVSIGYNNNAAPADTIVTRDYYSDSADYHWTPPADQAYTFDLEKAKAALDAAGYTDSDGNGIREYEGKDITLGLYARAESTESQNCGKLITGWFEQIGLDIDYEVIDDSALTDKQFAYDGDQFAPDFDMSIWGWGGDVDPNFILSIMTTGQIESWSDCNWSNAEYDKLFLEQQTTIDLQERIALVQRMQQIVYDESPYIPLVYPLDLENANTGQWTGWVRANENKGAWWYNTQLDSYLAVHPGRRHRGDRQRRIEHRRHRGHRRRRRRRPAHRRAPDAATRRARRDGDVSRAPAHGAGARARRREGPAHAGPSSFQEAKLRYGRQLSWTWSTWSSTKAAGPGGRGGRMRRRPARCSGRSPFLRLQGAHEVTRLSQVSEPPLERGTTWSTVRCRGLPQYWQRCLSRAKTARREMRAEARAARDADVGVEADDERDLVGAALAVQGGAGLLEHLGLVLEQQHKSSPHRTDVERLVGGVQDQHLAHRSR